MFVWTIISQLKRVAGIESQRRFFEHPKHTLKLIGMKIFTILCSSFFFIYLDLWVLRFHGTRVRENCIQNFHLGRYIVEYMVEN